MEEAYLSTGWNGEFRYNDEQTKRMDGCIDMLRGWINILETSTLQGTKKELKRLVELREKYAKAKMEELSEKQNKKE